MGLLPLIVLGAVFVLVAVRQLGRFHLQIWQVMCGGAIAVVVTGQISPLAAALAINFDVVLFLLGMFVVGSALEASGYLAVLSHRLFSRARNTDQLVLLLLFGIGGASAIRMNDTLAIIGTPAVLALARRHGLPPKMMLLALAFAITTGSAVSPIGNPQNLLVAVQGGMGSPFLTFGYYLMVPTLVGLVLCYAVLRAAFRREFGRPVESPPAPAATDPALARMCRLSLAIVVVLIAARIAASVVVPAAASSFRLTYIALAAAVPVLLASPRRVEILSKVDWHTLLFFEAMFVLMESVWETGFFQGYVATGSSAASNESIIGVSLVLSQFISNVPLVALYLPVLAHAGAGPEALAALAAGSTPAGNLLILGAASNVIIIQNAESRGETLSFRDFAKVGAPLTALQAAALWAWLLPV
jgi:Na+/H+ antiporter NhaD/arsenite permease-like protein